MLLEKPLRQKHKPNIPDIHLFTFLSAVPVVCRDGNAADPSSDGSEGVA